MIAGHPIHGCMVRYGCKNVVIHTTKQIVVYGHRHSAITHIISGIVAVERCGVMERLWGITPAMIIFAGWIFFSLFRRLLQIITRLH